ncbi:hypothetical protein N7447_002631 [Penicillium robsamsonii]|uniref:uncharacterized protein n=1 Tax=Penicillium robsamsonii TaxID=1792511 RepID=UPI002549ABDE|nr:uncharacterized protein N7447_002631 [Penicillium robsamsonii]KAJ5836605.1 hypothetical protein N7447_002631 [Penicillium robsamsonii]
MVSTSINFSGLMCLVLALGPANVLSAPQLPGLSTPDISNHGPETASQGPGNSETSAGSGISAGIPGGPYANMGAGFHDIHRGPCGPNSGDDWSAGAGMSAGIPGGPSANLGQGVHHHEGGYPCPEPPAPVVVPATTVNPPPVVVVPTTTVSPPNEVIPPTTETVVPTTEAAVTAILPPTFTTPISVPLTTAPAAWAPAVPSVHSTPLIPHAAPTASASPSAVPSVPVFNAGSSLVPGSVLAVALPVILAFFQ